MIGLDDEPLTDEWKDWTPTGTPATPRQIAQSATAFDYWQITDPAYEEQAWSALFAILGEVRSEAPADYNKTFRMIMTVLEPGASEGLRFVDVTFLVSKVDADTSWEGLAVRIWRELPSGATPAVSVLLRRSPRSPDIPSDLFLWVHSDFAETPSYTLRMRVASGQWTQVWAKGISMTPTEQFEGEGKVLSAIMEQTFWAPFTGSAYLETPVSYRDEANAEQTRLPIALGATLGDRDIDQVFSDSVFAPRLTQFPPLK